MLVPSHFENPKKKKCELEKLNMANYLCCAVSLIYCLAALEFGLAIWEALSLTANPVNTLNSFNKQIFGFVTVKCVLNFIASIGLSLTGCAFSFENELEDETTVQSNFFQILNGVVSVWGVVLYFGYFTFITVNSFEQILFVESVLLFIYVGIIVLFIIMAVLVYLIGACINLHHARSEAAIRKARVFDRLQQEKLTVKEKVLGKMEAEEKKDSFKSQFSNQDIAMLDSDSEAAESAELKRISI